MRTIYDKLNLSKDDYKDYLCQLYDSGLSQRSIADQLNVHVRTIEKHFKINNILTRKPWNAPSRHKYADISEKQMEVLDGILLADGHLDASSIAARLTYGCEFRRTLYDIEEQLDLSFSPHCKSKTGCWHFKSHSYIDLLAERKRWYPNGKKIVPDDVRLTPRSAYWWYIGDGYKTKYGLCFCTDSFNKKSIDILRNKLFNLGYDTTHVKSRNRIRIKGSKSRNTFLCWVKDNITISKQYLYKWTNELSPRRKNA